MQPAAPRPRLLLLVSLAALPACSDTKDWSAEIIVQVFKARSTLAPKIIVEAEQGKKKGVVELAGAELFQSCTANRVRIIQDPAGGEVTITARVATNPLLRDTQRVLATHAAPVKLVLSRDDPLEPAGCAPPIAPPDSGVKRRTAEACTTAAQCQGGVCLREIAAVTTITFADGYCSTSCKNDSKACGADEQCVPFQNGNGDVVGAYCLLKCSLGDAGTDPRCRLEQYKCTTGGLCFPK